MSRYFLYIKFAPWTGWGAPLAEAKGGHEKGLQRVNDALFTAADKGLRLWQADILVLCGRLRLQQFHFK
jgi:hypothetical protein